ncbi:MAG TPA: hypothetical protein VM283_02305 [Armatimonadota bacterium]|nr:hypothetical protein [Armatimonadota bacterium]
MSDERFEERLRRTPLAAPGPDVREELLAGAGGRRRGLGGPLRWGLAAAAAALIAVNLMFGHVHEARMARIMGPSQPAPQITHDARWAEALAEREQLMREMLGANQPDVTGGDDHEQRPGPGFRTSRRHTWAAFV